jgi:mannose-1-phosphate guanylyltransferase
MASDVRTIVLAAGAGRRLAPRTGGIPKQYWRPEGGRSLLEETVLRLQPLSPPERMLTVVADGHQQHLRSRAQDWSLGEVVYQPMDRGTAAGVLLPLVKVAAASPNAVVVITPSDHGVEDAELFRASIRQAIRRIEANDSEIVLFGVEPSAVTEGLSWIVPASGLPTSDGFRRVASFVESRRSSKRSDCSRWEPSGTRWC